MKEKMYLWVDEILAIGCNKRFAHFHFYDEENYAYMWLRIPNSVYQFLRSKGVLTSQKKRWMK